MIDVSIKIHILVNFILNYICVRKSICHDNRMKGNDMHVRYCRDI
jgi:hypothetical protein